MSHHQQKIFIISGPSRVGKDAITRGLLRKRRLNLQRVITATSRPKRQSERDGKHYYFFTREEFEQKVQEGYFLEWAVLRGGRYFGTPMNEFDRIKAQNKNVIMNIDVQGAYQLARVRDDIIRIFIKPDSLGNLKRRMKEARFTPEQMKARLADMRRELKEAKRYDYIVMNREGKLKDAIEEIAQIIAEEIKE